MQEPQKSRWNPCQVRRTVRLADVAGDVLVFTTKSFTSEAAEDKYHPAIDLATGAALCDCPHYQYRLARRNPNVQRPGTLCKHLLRALATCQRRGLLPGEEGVR
ncbi:MAG TPA: hypothetical protein VGM37_20505 [Armatimonadota bacterium]